MRAVILAGGAGTRLHPYTTVLPKPLVPIGDRPILERIIRQLARCGFTDIDLCIGHLGELIRAYIEQGTNLAESVTVRYHHETEALGTAGAIRQLEAPTESFLVMNGDILTTLDYRELMRFHRSNGASLTIASRSKAVPIELGVIEHRDDRVTGYVEKPALQFTVSMGVYVYEPRILEFIPERHFDFPDLVHALVRASEPVAIYQFDGEWFDVGTATEYSRALAELERHPERFDPDG